MPFSCENLFCFYNDEERCILRYPRLDFAGQCKSKVYPHFDKEYINTFIDNGINLVLFNRTELAPDIAGYNIDGLKNGTNEKELAKLAEQGDVWAQNVMGSFLTTASYSAAVEMFRKAAEKGNAFAQCALGECYAQGEGVEQDFTQAAIWFRKAAEQGHPQGQLMLAMCYRQGTGVKKDEKLAAYWCRQAADQGYEKAKAALKEIGE